MGDFEIDFTSVLKVADLAVDSPVARWHVAHGWCYNVRWRDQTLGVFYVSLLGNDGGVMHFETIGKPRPMLFYATLRMVMEDITPLFPLVFATPLAGNRKLMSILRRVGFEEVRRYRVDGVEKVWMSFLKNDPAIVNP